MNHKNTRELYSEIGGAFYASPVFLSQKLQKIKALVFDWDGVFHGGAKQADGSSTFSEVDSMGLNMLRYGYFLQNGNLPLAIIITGENNPTARAFAQREHFDAVFYKAKNKVEALRFIEEKHDLRSEEVLFCFDDILDLSMAKEVGARFLINRLANPYFAQYCKENDLADYRTAATGDQHALREVSELCLALLEKFEATTENRIAFSESYKNYWDQRQARSTHFFTPNTDGIFEEQ